MEAALLSLASWLEAAGISDWPRSASWVYPAANTLHVLGVVMLIGGIGVVDLRFAGAWPSLPADALSRALTPVAIAGLVILAASGTILFASDGPPLARSATFHRKLVLIGLALANAAAFRLLWRSGGRGAAVRIMAAISLLLWLSVGTLGRLIAYS